jgi:hypothetical protein
MYPPNITVEWVDTDKPEDAIYEKDIKYTFNEYGFRSDSFESRSYINILVSGCSMTVGVGVDQHEAWPYVLKRLLQEYTGKSISIWNLATSGASPDYVARSVYKTISILNPDFVCVFWPPITRIELPDNMLSKTVIQSFVKNNEFPKCFVNDSWLEDYAYMKNLILVKSLCEINNAKFVSNTVVESIVEHIEGDYFEADSEGRDGMHPSPKWHETGARFYFNHIKQYI